MALLEEMLACFGRGEWSCNLVYPKGFAVTGYKKIVELSGEQIILSLPNKKRLKICGESLSISSLAESEIFVGGIVNSLEVYEN